jgi:glucose-1-phosphate thymidylyltransferase
MVEKAIVVAAEPTNLLPVANRPLAIHALAALARAGVKGAAVTVKPALRAQLEHELGAYGALDTEVICVEQREGDPFPAVLADLGSFVGSDPFVLHLADSLNRDCLGSLIQGTEADGDSTVLVQETVADEAVVDLARRRAGAPPDEDERSAAGVWVLGPAALDALCEAPSSGCAELDVTRAVRRLADMGGRVCVRQVSEWWRFQERPGALLDANRFVLAGMNAEPVHAELSGARIQGPVSIHPSARIESSIVRGPAVIAAGVRLREAYVGPYTSIGEDVLIEGAEVENSIILAGASVTHLGGRLEASVVGPRARVFRDFRLPKAMRLNVGEGAEVSLA